MKISKEVRSGTIGVAFLMVLSMVGSTVPLRVEASHRSSTDWRSWWEGTREGEAPFDEDFFEERRRESSSLRRKINALDDDPVENLPIPILFGVTVTNLYPSFGDPRSGDRTHEGLDILAPLGAPVVSSTEAVVLRTGRGSSAGNYVYTANPGGETFAYMHLDAIADDLESGDELEEGSLIGYVGNTGNASGGPAHLHFEIRDNGAEDPHPRLTEEFSLKEKIEIIGDVLDELEDDDQEALALFVAQNYDETLHAAVAGGIELPSELKEVFEAVGATAVTTTAGTPALSDVISVGSRGTIVQALQAFLIAQHKGPSAEALAQAGATGYFGALTQAALAEYQQAVGITPANGYFGPITQAHILGLSADTRTEDVPTAEDLPESDLPIDTTTLASLPQINLTLGAQGAGVIWLQNFLITKSTGSAATELARVGATDYFGSLTQAALAEYQLVAGISPALGYYGPLTRAYIKANEG